MDERIGDRPISPGRRAAAYWFSDGVSEISWGLSLSLLGVAGALRVIYRSQEWTHLLFAAATIAYLVVILGERKILGFVKARLTYPRTGYAEPPADGYPEEASPITLNPGAAALNRRENVTAFRLGAVQLLILAPIVLDLFPDPLGLIVMMVVVAALIYWAGKRSEPSYSVWSVLPLALLGIPLSAVKAPAHAREYLAILAAGLWLSSMGLWNLSRYLRQNPLLPRSHSRLSDQT